MNTLIGYIVPPELGANDVGVSVFKATSFEDGMLHIVCKNTAIENMPIDINGNCYWISYAGSTTVSIEVGKKGSDAKPPKSVNIDGLDCKIVWSDSF